MTEEVLVDDGDPRIEVRPEALLALVGEHRFTPREACTYYGDAVAESEGELGVLHVGETLVRVAILKDKPEPIRLGPFRTFSFLTAEGREPGDDITIGINARARTPEIRQRIISEILRGPIASGEMAADKDARDFWMVLEVSRHKEA